MLQYSLCLYQLKYSSLYSSQVNYKTLVAKSIQGVDNEFRPIHTVTTTYRQDTAMSSSGSFNYYYSPYVDRPIHPRMRNSSYDLGSHRQRHQPWDTLAVYGGDSTRFGDYRRADTRSSWNNRSVMAWIDAQPNPSGYEVMPSGMDTRSSWNNQRIMAWMNAQPNPSGYEVMSNGMYRRIGQFGQGYRHL